MSHYFSDRTGEPTARSRGRARGTQTRVQTRHGLTRRGLLLAGAALGLQLVGCGQRDRPFLSVQLLQNSVPSQLIKEFFRRIQQTDGLSFQPFEQYDDAIKLLQTLRDRHQTNPNSPPFSPDWMGLGDSWLTTAIQQELIRPIPALDRLPQWNRLPDRWQAMVRRDRSGAPSETGEIWGAPYRWGSLVLVYRKAAVEKLGWTPSTWEDLWRPELQGRVSVLDSARVVLGLTLKQLGQSANATDLTMVTELETRLQALHSNVRFYSSDAYLEPLLTGDTWVAMGWSTDVLPRMKSDRRLNAVIPESGTLLFADLWVTPLHAPDSANPLAQQWLEFCWDEQIAERLTSLSFATSPLLQPGSVIVEPPLLLPEAAVMDRSEWLAPLPPEAIAQYGDLWLKIRQTVGTSD